jgi:hypothetical protein
MTKIIDIMTDLETLGKHNSPAITQIAAVPFKLETGEILPDEFNQMITPMSCVKFGLDIEGDTLSWWMTQEKEAIEMVIVKSIQEGIDLKECLVNFNEYINSLKHKYEADEIRIHGNGVLSDIKWLESAYLAVGIEPAWSYREPTCVRSLIGYGQRFFDINPKETIPFIGIKHYAIDDCKHQISYCCEIARVMMESKKALDLLDKKKKKSLI